MSNSEAPFCHIVETRGIRPTPSDQSLRSGSTSLADTIAQLHGEFALGWSHYVTLLSIDDDAARRFYEIEAADNGWSVRELKRQLDSSLYERLALSRDKRAIRRLAREGQIVEKASDLIKDPLVLEFLGLEERHTYSERELETAIMVDSVLQSSSGRCCRVWAKRLLETSLLRVLAQCRIRQQRGPAGLGVVVR